MCMLRDEGNVVLRSKHSFEGFDKNPDSVQNISCHTHEWSLFSIFFGQNMCMLREQGNVVR